MRRQVLLAALGALLCPKFARAHLVSARFGDFFGGALHVLSGLEHALLLVALGLLAGLQPRERGRWMLGAVPLGMLLGGPLPRFGISTESAAPIIITLLILTGGLTAARAQLPGIALTALGAIAGGVMGYENGLAMTDQVTGALFVAGVSMMGLVLVTPVTAAVAANSQGWKVIAVRSVGSWLTAVGLIMVALVLRPA